VDDDAIIVLDVLCAQPVIKLGLADLEIEVHYGAGKTP
jgi:hypothetical protein